MITNEQEELILIIGSSINGVNNGRDKVLFSEEKYRIINDLVKEGILKVVESKSCKLKHLINSENFEFVNILDYYKLTLKGKQKYYIIDRRRRGLNG